MSLLVSLVAETEELAPLWLPGPVFPAIAAAVFLALGFVVWSFRDVSNRQAPPRGTQSTPRDSGH